MHGEQRRPIAYYPIIPIANRTSASVVLPGWPCCNALGVAFTLAIGAAMGHASSGLIGATGALNVAFSDGSDPYRHRLRRMLTASLTCGLAVLAGGLCGRHQALAAPLIGVCGFAAGLMVALVSEATDIANVTQLNRPVCQVAAWQPMRPENFYSLAMLVDLGPTLNHHVHVGLGSIGVLA